MVAIPGPSIVPDRVRAAMARPMPDIYGTELLDLSLGLRDHLSKMARTTAEAFIVVSNGHGAWQMAISNTLGPGDKILVLDSGHFARLWSEYASLAGTQVEFLPGDYRSPFDPDALEARLALDSDNSIKAILVAHTDTISSVRNDIAALRAAIDRVGHEALLYVDAIASLACDPFEMDSWGVDITVAASQKGFMCPPGLGFVWANDKAQAAMDPDRPRVGAFDWFSRKSPKFCYDIFAGTPQYHICTRLTRPLT